MKKSLIALAIAGALAAPMVAQSNPLLDETIKEFEQTTSACYDQAAPNPVKMPSACLDSGNAANTLTMLINSGIQPSDTQKARVASAMLKAQKALRILKGE